MKKLRLTALLLCLLMCFCACAPEEAEAPPAPEAETPLLRLHAIDVGQGDATFVEFPDGQCMLIDAGERDYGAVVCEYIKALNYTKIDYLIGSHPHSDHIGGLAEVLENFEVGQVWMPKKASTTATFEKLLKTVKAKGLTIQTALAGKQIVSSADWKVQLLSPVEEDYGDEMNLYSAVVKITYGTQRFLIMGDAETENEEQMQDVAAEYIRVGHHGSKTSSSVAFVKRVGARYAVVSVGKDNSYGLPKDEILERWTNAGASVYRTDELGSIVARSDGKSIEMENAPAAPSPQTKPSAQPQWVLNVSSKKIHCHDCSAVKKIKDKNKQYSKKTAEQLLAEGYTPCGTCDPLAG